MAPILTAKFTSTDPFLILFTTELSWKSLKEEKLKTPASSLKKRDEALIA
jgi:hypothetical protein